MQIILTTNAIVLRHDSGRYAHLYSRGNALLVSVVSDHPVPSEKRVAGELAHVFCVISAW